MVRWGLAVAGLLLVGSCALAGESPDLQKQIDELKAKIDALEKKPAGPAATATEPKGGSWTDQVKLFGDLRLRGDYIDKPGWESDVADRERLRFRARLGLEAKLSDEVKLRFRIATDESTSSENGGDPTSANQTMTNSSSKKSVWWDLAMFDYAPAAVPGLHVMGGKIDQPFITVGKNEMIWDNNFTPEGGAVKYGPTFGDFEPIVVAGAYWLKERSDLATDTADSGMFGGQLGLKYNLSKEKGQEIYFLAGGGYFDYAHAEGFPVFDYTGGTDAKGNSKDGGEYIHDYDIAEAFAEVGFPIPGLELPVTFFGDWVRNTAMHDDDAQGYLVGARLGNLEKQWDWSLCYDYREVQKDCIIAAFAKCDIFGTGTNGKGHRAGAELMLMKNLWVGAYGFLGKANISSEDDTDHDADYRRVQLEINFKF
jgi:hypothetical protein